MLWVLQERQLATTGAKVHRFKRWYFCGLHYTAVCTLWNMTPGGRTPQILQRCYRKLNMGCWVSQAAPNYKPEKLIEGNWLKFTLRQMVNHTKQKTSNKWTMKNGDKQSLRAAYNCFEHLYTVPIWRAQYLCRQTVFSVMLQKKPFLHNPIRSLYSYQALWTWPSKTYSAIVVVVATTIDFKTPDSAQLPTS